MLFGLPALEEGKDVVSRRIPGLPSHLYLAMAMAIRAWVDHGSKMNLSYLCPSLIVTSPSQLRCGLWECLAKSSTSPEEHPELNKYPQRRQQAKSWMKHVLILHSKMWQGLSYHTRFLERWRETETEHKICKKVLHSSPTAGRKSTEELKGKACHTPNTK